MMLGIIGALIRGEQLHWGHIVRGPAVVDSTDSTVWFPEATTLEVSPHGTLMLEVRS